MKSSIHPIPQIINVSRFVIKRLLLVSFFVTFLVSLPGQNLRINEINCDPAIRVGSGFDYVSHEWVELYNADTAGVSLDGWTISNRDGNILINLPDWVLPGQSFLTIHQSVGTDDMDFEDLDGHYYTGDSTDLFSALEDECALYNAAPASVSIVDFVSWNRSDTYSPGVAHDFAVAAAIWNSGDFVNSQNLGSSDMLTRFFDGYDRDLSGDWHIVPWTVYAQNNNIFPENPVQELPHHRTVANTTNPQFSWMSVPFADTYEIQIDNDYDFSSPEVQVSGLNETQYTPSSPLARDAYFWRIRAVSAGIPTPWSGEWLVVSYAGTLPGLPKSCPHKWQHKDTRLLCIWDQGDGIRPGCPETTNCAWDQPHPDANPPTNGCEHGQMYCVAASIAMMNDRYGGDLSQDRITYQVSSTRRAAPEGDLGHDDGMFPPPGSNEEENALEWALNGANVTVMAAPFTFNQIKQWISERDCFMARVPGHMMVLDGYAHITSSKGDDIRVVYAQDPWSGPNHPIVFRYIIDGAPKAFFRRHDMNNLAHVFLQPLAGVTGRMQEASVTTDSDGDGVMDFDEINRFCSLSNNPDTDKDEVNDKNDIRSYTFHDNHHGGHDNDPLNFPDEDGDNLRAECDCDTDNDTDFDGGEDVNGNGNSPQAGETCVYDPMSFLLAIQTDKFIYQLWENVLLTGGTFHANSIYGIDIIEGCPTLPDSSLLAHDDLVITDGSGNIIVKNLGSFPPGIYKVVVDVLDDNLYRPADCHDPEVCFEVIEEPIYQWLPDTLRYPLAKTTMTNFIGLSEFTAFQGMAQYYNAPQAVTIYGVEFYAGMLEPDIGQVQVELYLAGNDSIPTGSPLTSATVPVDYTFGGSFEDLYRFASFPQSITVDQPFVVVIHNYSPAIITVAVNDYQNGDGQQEWLSSLSSSGEWLRSYDADIGGLSVDADLLAHPVVSYDFQAGFQPTSQCLSEPQTMVWFIDASSPVLFDPMYNQAAFNGGIQESLTWNFGDGTAPVQEIEPGHLYDGTGPYTVTLVDKIFGWTNTCIDTAHAVINAELSAAFNVSVAGNTVTLVNTTLGTPDAYLWTFGDGTGTVTESDPVHTYESDGEYNICLTLNFGCGSDQACQAVQACETMTAAFSSTVDRKTVDFEDMSSGTPVSWLWDFGDGNTSTTQHPTNDYSSDGTYMVSLLITNYCGDQDTVLSSVDICAKPLACFSESIMGLSVTFTDESTESPDNWLWDFGDGAVSQVSDPMHMFDSSGTYIVCLVVNNDCGVDTFCNSIVIDCMFPEADFSFTVDHLNIELTDATSGDPNAWLWDFGDGNTSTAQNPSHTYVGSGTYVLTLISFNECGSDTISQTIMLTPVDELNALVSVNLYPNPTKGKCFLESHLKQSAVVAIEVVNLLGQRVYYMEPDKNIHSQQIELDLTEWHPGVYLLYMDVEGMKYTHRILKLSK